MCLLASGGTFRWTEDRTLYREYRKLYIKTARGPQSWYVQNLFCFAFVLPNLRATFPDVFQDISLSQWLALTPPDLVKAHLGFSDKVIQHLTKVKQVIVHWDQSSSLEKSYGHNYLFVWIQEGQFTFQFFKSSISRWSIRTFITMYQIMNE